MDDGQVQDQVVVAQLPENFWETIVTVPDPTPSTTLPPLNPPNSSNQQICSRLFQEAGAVTRNAAKRVPR
jgi:hypothetical protein